MDNPAREATGQLGAYGFTSETRGERTIADVLRDIGGNIQGIVRAEMILARSELKEEGRKAFAGSTMLLVGALVGFLGFAFLMLTCVFALELVLPAWAAALIVGGVLVICSGIAASIGRERLKKVRMPDKTMQTMKEDVEWMKEQVRS